MQYPCAKLLVIVALTITAITAYAQKFPNVQEVGLRAPLNVKVDGKDLEWNGQFQAHNSNTNISYTMCNDDEDLYLAFQITEQSALTKLMAGGITLLIQKNGKKSDAGAMGIVYPFYEENNRVIINLRRKGDIPPPPELAAKAADSVMLMNNHKITAGIKYIGVKGITGVDSILSVYNQDGIKASGFFDNKKVYICEIAIPLKYLGIDIGSSAKFAYHVMLNGGNSKFTGEGVMKIMSGTDASGNPQSQASLDAFQARMDASIATMYATTDFWGEYTLAKK